MVAALDLAGQVEGVALHGVVDEDEIITARGVASSIDLGLYLCEKLAGREARERIRQQMDYQGSS